MIRTQTVGLRDLRQNLSEYVRRANAGECFEVTERSRTLGVLAPVPGWERVLERLIAEGRLIPAQRGIEELGPEPDLPVELPLSEALAELRRES